MSIHCPSIRDQILGALLQPSTSYYFSPRGACITGRLQANLQLQGKAIDLSPSPSGRRLDVLAQRSTVLCDEREPDLDIFSISFTPMTHSQSWKWRSALVDVCSEHGHDLARDRRSTQNKLRGSQPDGHALRLLGRS